MENKIIQDEHMHFKDFKEREREREEKRERGKGRERIIFFSDTLILKPQKQFDFCNSNFVVKLITRYEMYEN